MWTSMSNEGYFTFIQHSFNSHFHHKKKKSMSHMGNMSHLYFPKFQANIFLEDDKTIFFHPEISQQICAWTLLI